ncbi:GIY-YIG nuclease family protein [Dethiobacter alkaliphilus]|uniref:Excinuclease ABC C subunit domain protein n=1 Tax=Dethiobacter alkaliphilus AHT 1 TaxID=555088 RepID=C0GFR2_DETAL|nr:GIY-YIG nuclease family protein [Dethiobacter alkaliphilus]EEG78022.1 Excinuclease ABC C subunit domain protein [Dethiobacter alkaliphilus AHT 1]
MAAFVYILKCADDTLYTGWTTCLKKRVRMHNSGKAAKYTRARLPVEIVWWEEYEKKEDAMRREREIKGFPRSAKMELIIAATNG